MARQRPKEIDEIAWLKTELAKVKDGLSHFDKKANLINSKATEISKGLKACNDRLRNIDKAEVEEYLEGIRDRGRELNVILRGHVNRSAVLTELCAYTRENHPDRIGIVLSNVATLFDMEHEWWIRHEHLTIGEWFELLNSKQLTLN